MTINKAVAIRTSKLLLEKELTCYKLAKKTGLPESTIENIMAERQKDVRLSTIYKLAFGFDMTFIEFLNTKEFFDVDLIKDLN